MAGKDRSYPLPDFCHVATLLEVVVLGELLAAMLALLPGGGLEGVWRQLGLYSIFIQWIALTGVALLCLLRLPLQSLSTGTAFLLSFLIMLAVTALVSELSYSLYLSQLAQRDIGHAEFVLRAVVISALISAIALRYFMVQQRWRRNVEAVQRARLEALQSRIQPHFLFNSLNTIASLIPERPQQAEGLIEDLSGLFRASLAGERPLHRLADELELTRAYLNLEQQRLGERLRLDWQVGEAPEMQVPPLILQPLVENAVRHGIEPLTEGGEVAVRMKSAEGGVTVEVENPLRGTPSGGGHRMALANVEERLHAVFGGAARLWRYDEGDRFTVELFLPIKEKD
jgi:two-component system sensor histidine kinase AlgZ